MKPSIPSHASGMFPSAGELLPCPFCGSSNVNLDHLSEPDDYFVSCGDCEIQQIANYSPDVAIARWNKRAFPRSYVPATAGSCPEPHPDEKRRVPTIEEMHGSIDFGGKMKVDADNEIYFEREAPAVPFSLPLRPHGQQNQDNIDDADGWPVIIIYGNPDDPLTLRQVEYVIAAVNSYEELKRQIDELSQRGDNWKANYHSENDDKKLWQRKTASAEQQKEELLKALEWAMKYLSKLVSWGNSGDAYINGASTELAGFAAAFHKAEDTIAKYKRGDQQ